MGTVVESRMIHSTKGLFRLLLYANGEKNADAFSINKTLASGLLLQLQTTVADDAA